MSNFPVTRNERSSNLSANTLNAREKLTIGGQRAFGQLTAVGGTLNIQAGCVSIPGKLVVGDKAVFNDIEIKGCIVNKQLEMDRDCQVPSTEEIYNEWFVTAGGVEPASPNSLQQNVLEVIEDFVIDPFAVVAGTEPDGGSLVFGYNPDQTLDVAGGVAKSYASSFTDFNLRYHGVNASKLVDISPARINTWMQQSVSYYHQRGYPIQSSDVTPEYQGIYRSTTGFVWTAGSGEPYIAMKFSGTNYLDLNASASLGLWSLGLYEPNSANFKNNYSYPLRIPITTDCSVFNKTVGVSPIVYYDEQTQKITIHVPSTPVGHFLGSCFVDTSVLEPGQFPFNPNFQDYLDSFDGTFSLMRRRASDNKIVRANIASCQYIVQASSEVSLLSKSNVFGPQFPFGATVKYQEEPGAEFTGICCPLMNGEDSKFDVYAYNSIVNANVIFLDPFEFAESGGFAAGDLPSSTWIEGYGAPSLINMYDNAEWSMNAFGLPKTLMGGDVAFTYPENVGAAAVPTTLTSDQMLSSVVSHEFAHNTQAAGGHNQFLPVEGMATGLEQDPKLGQVSATHSTWLAFRPRRWSQVLTATARGDWSLMQFGSDGSSDPSYGMGLFFRWLATQFDSNYQVMRRTGDIISNAPGHAGQLLRALDIPAFITQFGFLPNSAGQAQAFDQALGELYSKNIKDLYTDFAVSIAFLRNNTSIPAKWQHNYPYWINSTAYAGYATLVASGGVAQDFWELLDTNGVIPSGWGVPASYEGETFYPTLSTTVAKDVRDLTSMIFNIDKGTTTDVTVTITAGEWRFYMVQFTTAGNAAGAFIEHVDNQVSLTGTGTHTFLNMPGTFTGAGSIRLVCVNVTMTNYPGNSGLDNYAKFPINSGSITISKV